MGCDIHAYIDVEHAKLQEQKEPYVSNFAALHISRDYLLFAHMAGVRDRGNTVEHVSPPKGLPSHISWRVQNEYTLYVVEDDNYEKGDYSLCSRSSAERWLESGASQWYDEKQSRVTHPDWHSASWLSLEELLKVHELYIDGEEEDWSTIKKLWAALDRSDSAFREKWDNIINTTPKVPRKPNLDLLGIIAAMKAFQEEGVTPRLVFWFDN